MENNYKRISRSSGLISGAAKLVFVEGKNRWSAALSFLTIALVGMTLFFAGQAHAANTITAATVNGGTTTTVAPGATISMTVTNTTSGGTSWGSTAWYIGTTAPGPWNCDIAPTPPITTNGTNTTTLVGTVPITAPATAGTYNVYFRTSSNTSCGGTRSATFVLTGGVVVTTAPAATTTAATSLTTTGATLNGTVSSNGASTTVTFDYGLTASYGSTATASTSPLAATASNTAVSAAITGLTCNTTYHFRVRGVNSAGTTNGSDLTFTTTACLPTVTTNAATSLAATTATLNGTVSSNGASTTVTFDYGTTASYGSSITATQSPLAAGASGTAVSAALSGLTCNTTYHFRAKGLNSTGTTNGGDLTFTTSACPVFCTQPPNIPIDPLTGKPLALACECDTFNRSTLNPSTIFGANWIVSTSDTTGILPSIVNPGYLRLTNNTGNNAKAATVPGIFPAAGNYISVEFQQYAYNGSGADGIAVTLSDYSVPAVPGAYGGSLGYAQKTGINGFAGGWVGVALDEYGNYENASEGRIGGISASTLYPQSVGVRGSGTGTTGYPWLGGATSLSPGIDNRTSTTPSYGYFYQVIVDARNAGNVIPQTFIAVNRDTTGGGSSYSQIVAPFDVFAVNPSQAAVPTNWQISFTGSTGGSNNIHEISGVRICAQTVAPTSGGTAGGFNAIDEAYGTPPLAVQDYLSGHIYTKLVGASFKLNGAALNNSQILTTYAAGGAKTVTVNLVDNSDSIADATKDCTLSCTSTCTSKSAVPGGTQTMTFAAGATDKGQKQSPSFTINTSYQKLVAIISDGVTTACSTDSFSVRPLSIASVTFSATGAGPFKAGSDNFTLTATTAGITGNASGYIGVPKINNTGVMAVSPATVAGAIAGNFSAAVSGTPSSTATGTTFTYNEVGSFLLRAPDFTLTPTRIPGVYDDTWTAVDSGANQDCVTGTGAAAYSNTKDTSGTYTTNLNFGKYGCNFGITADTAASGRFIPDHFDTVISQVSNVPMPCPAGLTCPALYNGFVYSGQPFTTNVYARNASGALTLNYDGVTGLSKQVTLSAWNAAGGATAIGGGNLNGNAIPAASFRSGTTVSPGTPATPNFSFTTTPTAPTDIYIRANDADNVSSLRAISSASVEGGVKVVSGRINVSNAYGSEMLPLTLMATLQYWGGAGAGYVTSATDTVNVVTAAKTARSGCLGMLQSGGACSTTLGTVSSVASASSGVYSIKLGAPGSGNTGSEYLAVTGGGWPAYLPSNLGRAIFGVYKGAKEFIYMREAY